MESKIKQFIKESKIVNFFGTFNKKIVTYFYNSKTHELFLKLNSFFKNSILKNIDNSLIIKTARNIARNVTRKDLGLFIILVVLFNTLAMLVLKKDIDVFSVLARAFFIGLGIFFILHNKR